MSETKKLIPKRRFKEFQNTGEWEERALSDICEKFTDGDWIEAKDQSTTGIRLIQTGNIGITQYFDKSNNTKWISKDAFDRLNCKEIFPGDILISRLPEPAGRACIVPDIGQRMITAVDCTIVRVSPNIDSKYLVQYLATNTYFSEVNIGLAGGTRQRISRSNLAKFKIPLPKFSLEQEKIGKHFEELDNLIILQQRKLEKIKAMKKAYLYEMFPAEGESKPKRRFKGFTDEWERCRLSKIATLTSSKRIHVKDYVDGGVPFYRGKEITELRDNKVISELLYISLEKYEEIDSLYGSPQKGDILITAVGTIGNTWVVDETPFYFKDGNLIWFKNIKCNSRFLDYALNSPNGSAKVMSSAIGSNQKALTMVKLKEIAITVPCIEEQERIGNFFLGLDNLLIFHQSKLDKLKNLKKSYLNEMFI